MNRDDMIRDGWRQCAKGQKTTQFCEMLEQAVAAEREACAKLCDDRSKSTFWLRHPAYEEAEMCAAAIRMRGDVPESRQPQTSNEGT